MTSTYVHGASDALVSLGLEKRAGGAKPPGRVSRVVSRLFDKFRGAGPAEPPLTTPSGPSRGHLRLVTDAAPSEPAPSPPTAWQKAKTTPLYRYGRLPLKAGLGVAHSLYTGDEERPMSHRLVDAGVAGVAGMLPYTFGLGGPVLGSIARGAITEANPNW